MSTARYLVNIKVAQYIFFYRLVMVPFRNTLSKSKAMVVNKVCVKTFLHSLEKTCTKKDVLLMAFTRALYKQIDYYMTPLRVRILISFTLLPSFPIRTHDRHNGSR